MSEEEKPHSRAERHARIEAMQAQRMAGLMQEADVQKLRASDQYPIILELLGKRQRPKLRPFEAPPISLEMWLYGSVKQCLAEPDLAETMTGSERRKVAADINRHCEALSKLLQPFKDQKTSSFGWPFQPVFDGLALDMSIEQTKDWERDPEELEDIQHWRRYGIYGLLMDSFDDILGAVVESAEWFAGQDTLIKKPNDPNARRLYFLRTLTRKFCGEFRSPCRAAALALAGVYFDCSDLDEASISKLAPVEKRKPIAIPAEELQSIIDTMEQRLGRITDPEDREEFECRVNEMKEILSKSSDEHSGAGSDT